MRTFITFILVACCLCATRAAAAESELMCGRAAAALTADAKPTVAERHYAPDRLVDVLHLSIDVTPDFRNRSIRAMTTIRFKPITKPLRTLRLDAVDLHVRSVTGTVPVASFDVTEDAVVVSFKSSVPEGSEAEVTVTYDAEPRKGLYFRTTDMGYLPEDTHLWTQGETHEARHWIPCYDYPNERSTSEITCRVPGEMVVVSNGRQMSEETDPATGLKAVRWLQEKPHVSYLIALVAGNLKGVHDSYRDIPLGFYTPASQIGQAQNSFDGTADILAFFEGEIGVPYPWALYNQVVVDDFTWGGMENTTLTVLTDRTLFVDGFENLRSSQGLVAHELAHQWFGDYVTCKDWGHAWLNEGFATYYDWLYDGHKHGREKLLYRLYRSRRSIAKKKDTRAIVTRVYKKEMEQFSYRSYVKGGWVLHMLRSQLGEDLFRACVKAYLDRHALQSVVAEDLNSAVEALSGLTFDRFFDQWVYHGGVPHLKVEYSWIGEESLAKVSVEQTQEVGDDVLLFTLPTAIRFVTDAGVVDKEVVISEKSHDFYFHLDGKPKVVLFDPEVTVLAKIEFKKPTPMLYAQLALPEDVVARLDAIDGLKSKKDRKTRSKLKDVLNSDAFYGVRVSAASALASMKAPESFEALAGSMVQENAKVRRRVVRAVGASYRKESLRQMLQVLDAEGNPDIRADALKALGKFSDKGVEKRLRDQLGSTSYRNLLAGAAIQAMKTQDDPTHIKPVMKTLGARELAFTSYGFGRGLGALAYLARNEDSKDAVRSFLAGYVNHKKRRVQRSAISALGTLGDPRAIPIVAAFSGGDTDDSVQKTASKTLKTLRAARKVSVELKDLRAEVTALKKTSEKMRKDLDDLKKRRDAKEAADTTKASVHGE